MNINSKHIEANKNAIQEIKENAQILEVGKVTELTLGEVGSVIESGSPRQRFNDTCTILDK